MKGVLFPKGASASDFPKVFNRAIALVLRVGDQVWQGVGLCVGRSLQNSIWNQSCSSPGPCVDFFNIGSWGMISLR